MTTQTTIPNMNLRQVRAEIRRLGYKFQSILSCESDPKTIKGSSLGYLTAIAYLAPTYVTCPYSKIAHCDIACLNTAGRGGMNNVQRVRHDRTKCYFEDNAVFMQLLRLEIRSHIRRAARRGMKPSIRLNGTSDIDWLDVIKEYPEVQFYDYTKHLGRLRQGFPWNTANYEVTLSWSSASPVYMEQVSEILRSRPDQNVAVVFRDRETVQKYVGTYMLGGRKVIDGDLTDLRFLDPKGSVIALYAKGRAVDDSTGFVLDEAPHLNPVS